MKKIILFFVLLPTLFFAQNNAKINQKAIITGADPVSIIANRIPNARVYTVRGIKTIAIRGRSSFKTAGDEVLWVVDGMIYQYPPPFDVNQIKYLEVLESLSATNRYGSQGGAGVIIIKTQLSESDANSGKNIWYEEIPYTRDQRDSIRAAKKAKRVEKRLIKALKKVKKN